MGRRQAGAEDKLCSLVDKYGALKGQETKIKSEIKPLNDEIKEVMQGAGLANFSGALYTAKLTERQNEDFNEEKAIEILKGELSAEDLKAVVRTKEYIDDDALENLVYQNKFNLAKLETCRTIKKPTVTLRITKNK